MSTQRSKTYINTYLYGKGDYEGAILKSIMNAKRIDKKSKEFEGVEYDVKRRQTTNVLVKVLANNDIILLHDSLNPLSKAFKVFSARDLKDADKPTRVFIDVSDIMALKNGTWACYNIDVFIARLVSAMSTYIYYLDSYRIQSNSNINLLGAHVFSILFTNIIDNLFKISTEDAQSQACKYFAAKYFLINIMGKEKGAPTVKSTAIKVADIGDARAGVIDMYEDENTYLNIKEFILFLAKTLKLTKLQLDAFINKWIFLYGNGTHFGLELFPSFSSIVTDAYSNSYINNQKTIEKLVGDYLVEFTRSIFALGEEYFR